MADYGTFSKGQEVFVKSPTQVYANVIGPRNFADWDGSEVYGVKLQPLTQYYRSQDLEPSQRAELIPVGKLDFSERAREIVEQINRRAYELFESSGFTHGHDREDWIRAQAEILITVPVDITETEIELTIRAEVPGVTEENLEVRVAPLALCIIGKRQRGPETGGREQVNTVYSERRSNQIFRVLDLPSEIDLGKLDVTLSDGILAIRALKAQTDQNTHLSARAASA